MSGTQIGRYRIVSNLGVGGFASVYLAEDPALATHVAIKVLSEAMASDGNIRARFIEEARLMRRLASPVLVTVHDISEQDGLPYFVMEYCEGGTLADRLEGLTRTATTEEVGYRTESIGSRRGSIIRTWSPVPG